MTLRQRIVWALAPLVCLLALIGTTAIFLLRNVGDRIEDILRENYASVEAMVGLNEALERIDSSFQFALQGNDDAKKEYDANWILYEENLRREETNITEPGEPELVERLKELTAQYRQEGIRFFDEKTRQSLRKELYFGNEDSPGLLHTFRAVKAVAASIRKLNQDSMVRASVKAKQAALAAESLRRVGAPLHGVIVVAQPSMLRRLRSRRHTRNAQPKTQRRSTRVRVPATQRRYYRANANATGAGTSSASYDLAGRDIDDVVGRTSGESVRAGGSASSTDD